MMKAKYISGPVLVLALSSCGGAADPPAGSNNEAAEEAKAEIVSEGNACTDSMLTWPAGATDSQKVCSGIWTYDKQCYVTNDSRCGLNSCDGSASDPYASCNVPTPSTQTKTHYLAYSCFYDPESRTDICGPLQSVANNWCEQRRVEDHNAIQASYGQYGPVTSSKSMTFQSSESRYKCTTTVNYTKPVYKAHSSCGCKYTYNDCYVSCGTNQYTTTAGMSRAALLGSVSSSQKIVNEKCTTGEDISSTSFSSKFNRISNSLSHAYVSTTPAIRDIHVRQGKLIAEYGDIGTGNRNALYNLYRNYPDTNPSCGSSYAGTAQSCDPEMDWRYRFCARLTSAHASPASVDTYFDQCVTQLIDQVQGHFGDASCDMPAQVDEMFGIQREFLEKHAAKLRSTAYSNRTGWIDASSSILGRLNHEWYQRLKTIDQSMLSAPLWDRERLDDELETSLLDFWQSAEAAAALDANIPANLPDPSSPGDAGDPSQLIVEFETRRPKAFEQDQRVVESAIRPVNVIGTVSGANNTAMTFTNPGNGSAPYLESQITLSGSGPTIQGLSVSLRLTGVSLDDLVVKLTSPAGTTATIPMGSRTASTQAFDGASYAGTWTLRVENGLDAQGSLDGFTLNVHTSSSAHALSDEPLLSVMGQAFSPIVERASYLGFVHDFACAYKKCGANPPSTRLSDLTKLFAAVDDSAALSSAVASSPYGHSNWKSSLGVLAASNDIQAALSSVAASQGLASPDATRDVSADWPAPTRRFISTMNTAKDLYSSYTATGFFEPPPGAFLQTRIHDSRRNDVQTYIANLKDQLQSRNSAYQAEAAMYVQSLIQTQAEGANVTALETRVNELVRELDDLTARKEAHVLAANTGVDTEADLARAVEQAAGAIEGTQYFTTSAINGGVPLLLSAADAHATGGNQSIQQLAAFGPIPVNKNEILSLNAVGQWAPQCALSERQALSPDGNVSAPVNFVALAGPEGYTLQWTGSSWNAGTYSSSNTISAGGGVRGEVCYGTSALGKAVGLSANGCAYAYASYDHSWRWDNSDGSESRYSASFSGGVHLNNTPFPMATAGSLLAVEVPRNGAAITDIHSVRSGNTTIRVSQDSDLYLVVNDKSCNGADTMNKVEVTGSVMQSWDDVAKNLVGRMRYVLNQVAGHKAQLTATREILPNELAAIRSQALGTLSYAQVGCANGDTTCFSEVPFSSYPPTLQAMFNAFLDKETVRLERAVRIANIEHEMARLTREIASVGEELRFAERRQALVNTMPAWHLRNVRADYLRLQMDQLTQGTSTFFLPVLELWYPTVLQNVQSHAAQNGLDNLLAADASTDIFNVATDMINVTQDALNEFAAYQLVSGSVENRKIAVSLNTRPDCTSALLCNKSEFKHVDPTVSNPIWSMLANSGQASAQLELSPQDVFQAGLATSQMSCQKELPVLIDMALVVVNPTHSASGRYFNGQSFGREQLFAAEEGMRGYTTLNSQILPIDIPVLYATSSSSTNVLAAFDAYRQQRINDNAGLEPPAIGLSPFTTMELSKLAGDQYTSWGFHTSNELILVMLVETSSSSTATPLSWIPTCR